MKRTQLLYPVAKVNGAVVASLQVAASIAVPWRTLNADGKAVSGELTAQAGYRSTGIWEVFKGAPDNPRANLYGQGAVTARGLPEFRKSVGPQSFQDANLETVLNWIAGQVGGTLTLNVEGDTRRHYQLSKTSAWRAVQEALVSWRVEYVPIELDDYSLYLGPEEESPHATAPSQATLEHLVNIYEFRLSAKGARIVIPAYPWLRVAHRVEVKHPLLSGTARVVQAVLDVNRRDTITALEVLTL